MRLYDVAEDSPILNVADEEVGETLQQFSETQNRLSKFAEWNV